ncbi:MAG: nucleoside triphosphate pyrophosphohydrolase [Gammaproteobacteria bacterium]|nr:nucleoside triphosphate pyrophosphohydrolase [Gammaproteobacteria bacterium]
MLASVSVSRSYLEIHPMSSIDRLLEVMRSLRDPDTGCSWDIAQTYNTIAPYTIEEAYEVADAVERGDTDDIRDELGDLLFQVVFQSRIAEESGHFAFDDVCDAIVHKMVVRHPHVFSKEPEATSLSTEELNQQWELQKDQERRKKHRDDVGQPISALDGVALNLPALTRAAKIQKRARRVGFDWPELAPVVDKVQEELEELLDAHASSNQSSIEDELGDTLFAVVNLARHVSVDPELALRRATQKFERRFREVERLATERSITLNQSDLSVLDELWDLAKAQETPPT